MGSQEGEISKLLSPSIYYGDCYAVEVILSLIYAALQALKWRGKGFICLLSKMAFYCVTGTKVALYLKIVFRAIAIIYLIFVSFLI